MNTDEYLKLAEVEDQMWYFRSLHAHVQRELAELTSRQAARAAPVAIGAAGQPPAARNASGAPHPQIQPPGSRVATSRPHVLDAGCGTGGLILRLRAAHPEWTFAGVDFMPIACELARKRCGPDVDIRVASITELPFADESFDAVVSADVVCQVDNPEVAASEFFRVLRPGGTVVLNVPAYMWMWSYHDESCQTRHRYTRPEIDDLLREAGFGGRRTTHWNALPFPGLWAKRKIFRSSRDTSDVKRYPAPVEAACNGLMRLEHAWLRAGGRWAWGTSVFGVGRKP
ncbi:MAG: class I SAM-dependent methyltransferase [Opitutaceae bacterium]